MLAKLGLEMRLIKHGTTLCYKKKIFINILSRVDLALEVSRP